MIYNVPSTPETGTRSKHNGRRGKTENNKNPLFVFEYVKSELNDAIVTGSPLSYAFSVQQPNNRVEDDDGVINSHLYSLP